MAQVSLAKKTVQDFNCSTNCNAHLLQWLTPANLQHFGSTTPRAAPAHGNTAAQGAAAAARLFSEQPSENAAPGAQHVSIDWNTPQPGGVETQCKRAYGQW